MVRKEHREFDGFSLPAIGPAIARRHAVSVAAVLNGLPDAARQDASIALDRACQAVAEAHGLEERRR